MHKAATGGYCSQTAPTHIVTISLTVSYINEWIETYMLTYIST